MVFICIGVFYTIFLIFNCIQYITNINRLNERRNSILYAQKISNFFFNIKTIQKNILNFKI